MFKKSVRALRRLLPLILCIVLFALPFFWFTSGEMDLGGDDNRLFFYDPIAYIRNTSLYTVIITGKGTIEPRYYDIPYVGLLALLKVVFSSPTILINIINGFKIAGGFIGIFLIVSEFMTLEGIYTSTKRTNIFMSAFLAGIFYIVSFGSYHMAIFWDRALTTHNQIFLNPILFYLLLKYLLTSNFLFVCVLLLITFVFAPNFSLSAVPPFFAFYPLALLFLLLYIKIIVKKLIPWRGLFVGGVLFLGIQAFHLLGQVVSMFDKNSYITNRVFDKTAIEQGGVAYFSAVRDFGKASLNILLPSVRETLRWTSFLAPLILLIGMIINKKKSNTLLLITLFFIVSLFLVTANITNVGFELYRKLFYLPGFSIFRNFYTQWMFVFIFFYSILFGYTINEIFLRFTFVYKRVFFISISILFIITGFPLFNGEIVNKNIIRGSNNIKSSFVFDPKYEQILRFIHKLPNDGKVIVLPLTDYYLQVILGKAGGAYEGPSTLRHLAGKYSFVGYQDFGYLDNDSAPYAEHLMKSVREKKYDRLLRIFTTLNIRYILHNSDPKAYEAGFSPGPFGYMQTSFPKTQNGYKDLINQLPYHVIYSNGPYVLYEIDISYYQPTIFIPENVYKGNNLSYEEDKFQSVFIDDTYCGSSEFERICSWGYKKSAAEISFTYINPTLYEVVVNNFKPSESLLLVMSNTYHRGWKLFVNGKEIAEKTHIPVNGYANGWLIDSGEIQNSSNGSFVFYIHLDSQKYFNYGIMISGVSLSLLAVYILRYSFIRK